MVSIKELAEAKSIEELISLVDQIDFLEYYNNQEDFTIYYNDAKTIDEKLKLAVILLSKYETSYSIIDESRKQEIIEQSLDENEYYDHICSFEAFHEMFDEKDHNVELCICESCRESFKQQTKFEKLYYADFTLYCVHELADLISFDESELGYTFENFLVEYITENDHEQYYLSYLNDLECQNKESVIQTYNYNYNHNAQQFEFICVSCCQLTTIECRCEDTQKLLHNSDSNTLLLCSDCRDHLDDSNVVNIEYYYDLKMSEMYKQLAILRNQKRFHTQTYRIKYKQTQSEYYSEMSNYFANYKRSTLDLERVKAFMILF